MKGPATDNSGLYEVKVSMDDKRYDRLQRLYDLKIQQIRKSKEADDTIRLQVMRAEAEAISQQLRLSIAV